MDYLIEDRVSEVVRGSNAHEAASRIVRLGRYLIHIPHPASEIIDSVVVSSGRLGVATLTTLGSPRKPGAAKWTN